MDDSLHRAFLEYEAKNPQYGEDWLSNLALHALDEDDEAVVYLARLGNDDFVACPIKINVNHKHASALSTFYTSAYSPVICSDKPEPLLQALFQHLASEERFSTLTLAPMGVDTPHFSVFQRALVQAGWKGCHDYFCFGNWIHDTQSATYEDYLASRPSKLRSTIRRKTQKFLAQDAGQLTLVKGGSTLEEAITQYTTVYNNSWKNEEPYRDFVPQLLRLAAKRGWLRLGIASYENQPVASQIWLIYSGTAYIFKLAYHEDYKRLSPGTVLTAYMMQRVIEEDHIDRIDYLSGDDTYKADWMSERREQHGIAAYNPRSPTGMAMLVGHTVKRLLKKLARR
ncbi:Uncharacterised protein [Halioglobus japonicus]|nr:Uncharacterised protein [Halioglobus japonicus]